MAAIDILSLLAIFIVLVYYWCKHVYSYWKRKGIPYIEPLPIIGNVKDLLLMKDTFGLYFSKIYNKPEFSDAHVVGLYMFNKPALLIREPEIMKSILIKDFNKFSNRYSNTDPHGDPLGSNNLFFAKNPNWKELRNKISPVFTSGKIKQMYPLMLEITAELEKYLEREAETNNAFVAEVKEICALFTTDLIATIAFGVRANSLQDPNGEFRTQGRKILDFTIMRAFQFFIAFFNPNLVTLLRIKLFTNEFSKFLRRTINYVMDERERRGTVRNDLIDILLALKRDALLKGHMSGKDILQYNDVLVAQAAVFLTAGFETSSSTMAFALYELSKNPNVQKRLRDEICGALLEGNGTIPYEIIQNLEYLNMVVDEVLRLYPILPFLDREHTKGAEDFNLKPYYDFTMPNGMAVYIPVYAVHRDPKYWSNPNTFDPERFSKENKESNNQFAYFPFGTGPRNCIGNRLGLLQTKLGLVHILKNHMVAECEKTIPEMKFDPKAVVLQSSGGIYLKIVNDGLFENRTVKT